MGDRGEALLGGEKMEIDNAKFELSHIPESAELLPLHRLETLCFLVQSISHDFHGYLLSIVGNAEHMRRSAEEEPVGADSCEAILRNARDAGRLVKKLQVLARLSLSGPPKGPDALSYPHPVDDA